ncbi:UBX domain-containing protein [Lachnellula occidentalis]|uniref:UBX domain-containing protein n=1 Tax=Lachnellula occidentalis TaxID=215460 RepID=A0A8H8S4S1_9HELO|nr:UBX domain-containing protein [Lachnellula occidentalis]
MFHDGDLQSGISKALEESKLVACFVTDEEEESNKWETEFIQEPDLKASLAEQTILLRLKAGSQEAAYLAAIFPLPKTPTLVVIKNGELKEYLAAGVTREEFMRRMGVVLGSRVVESHSSQESQPPVSTATTSGEAIPVPTSEQPSSAVPTSQPNQQSAANLLAERSARLQQQRKEQEKKSKGKGKAPADPKPQEKSPAKAAASPADMKYALMQKKRQQDAKDERARILKRVEDDKAQRRQDAAERKAARSKPDAESDSQSSATVPSSSRSSHPSTRSAECAVQVRLFDGSTIRSRFPSSGNLRVHVRQWIDEQQERDTPYTFKQVLTPLPNKNISISEEEETLQTLGLTPSATLILIAVDGYTSAYEGGGAGGLVYRGASAGYNIVSSSIGMVTGALGSLLGGGGAAPAQEDHGNAPSASIPSTSINVRTLRDQQRSDDEQFYNGNALNFEPRKDDDDKKED